ncbi:MAG: type IV pilus twitching motility protein PilT [Planctomycetes bacterium]|nr:type IV pilus twitching motility protein PilT [Planctomycetota bacterium]
MAEVDKFLRMAKQLGASDLHLCCGAPPTVRLHGVLKRFKYHDLTPEENERMIMEILTPRQKDEFKQKWELDLSYDAAGIARCRSNVCKQRRGMDATFRLIPDKIATLDELGFPPVIKKMLEYRQGLILVTGQAGCGKTTTLAAMVDHLNINRRDHIITLEDPIEIIQKPKGCHVIQREVGIHTKSFARALRAALREDPDIILVGEMRDLETISLAITAAETGHLVLGTLHTTNAARTIGRILDVFPPGQQGQIRAMVSESLRGIVSQQLLPTGDGKGRVVCMEILLVTPAISNLIREDRCFRIPSQMQTGVKLGMQLMDDHILALFNRGIISTETALERAVDRTKFTQIDEMRKEMINWDEFKELDDKRKIKACYKRNAVQWDRKIKAHTPINPVTIPVNFYIPHGKLPVDEILAELIRLFPDAKPVQ